MILAFISSRVPAQLMESDLKLDQAAVHFAQAASSNDRHPELYSPGAGQPTG